MSLTKRLRVIWAALTQQWQPERCRSCARYYWTQAAVERPADAMCPECETKAFGAWLNELEVRHGRKEVA